MACLYLDLVVLATKWYKFTVFCPAAKVSSVEH